MGDADGGRLLTSVERRLQRAGAVANFLGAVDLFLFGALLLPVNPPHVDRGTVILVNTLFFVPVMAGTIVVAHQWGFRESEKLRPWLESGRDPTREEHRHALRLALVQTRVAATMWLCATVAYTVLNAIVAPSVVWVVPVLMVLGAITTTTLTYLLAARIVRPVVACALATGLPGQPARPGVRGRVTIVWLCASGVPVLGIAATALLGVASSNLGRERLALSVLFLAVVALAAGFVATTMAARSLSDPLDSVRGALERVEGGDFDAEVAVDDASELGLVQAGFNRMAGGLREREHLRDVFGRHVGRDVARAALDSDVQLGGEVREVGVFFVDLLGSTAMASELEPERVVTLLNEFFALVVAVTEAHGGFVNKFEGDGALCIFGAPIARDDPAGCALAGARELRARLLDELPQVEAAIGVSAGRAVAGNVGAEQRFEYTVIGDPVNEASRLCDLAKRRPERIMASDAAVRRADPRETAHWELGEATVLRGRGAPTRIATLA